MTDAMRTTVGRNLGAGDEEDAPVDYAETRRLAMALLEDTVGAPPSLGDANSKERWNSYAELPARLSVLIPLPKISLNQLRGLMPGMMLISNLQTTQDMPLLVGDVFLANVSCEPAGERLGVRINGFDQPAYGL